MANIERIDKCIDLMRRAKNLNMQYWQDMLSCKTRWQSKSVRELHACGNTACFAGYLAVSKFFQEDGGKIHVNGSPEWDDWDGEEAVAKYLDISFSLARGIVLGSGDFWERFCDVSFMQVTPEHVIKVLKMIKRGELE